MRFRTRLTLAFGGLRRKVRIGGVRGLYQISALIRSEARQSIRKRRKASRPGTPPSAHTTAGLREINFHVAEHKLHSIIGPRKFKGSTFFDRPVPNIHEKGGLTVGAGLRHKYTAVYPERSFMWHAVKSLKRKGKLQSVFNITMQRSF